MPHQAFKLIPGVDENKTLALNEAALSTTNLVRFIPDRSGLGLVQKLGGWTKFFPNQIQSTVRGLWAWEDTNANAHLAVGAEALTTNLQAQLSVITDGTQQDITPRTLYTNVAVNVSSTSGSNVFTITDATATATSYDWVFIDTHISIGGVILYGLYQCTALSGTAYTINATNILGDPAYATSTVSNGGAVAQFATTSGSPTVTVTLNNHGFQPGDNYVVSVPTSVGGVSLYSNYLVISVPTANTFTIQAQNSASSTTTAYINNNKAGYVYYIGLGAIPAGTGYGAGAYGSGGYGTGTAIVPSTGTPVYATDWTMDNWGQILIACPHATSFLSRTTISITGTGATATLNFADSYVVPVGDTVIVSGVNPVGFNGTYIVTASTATTIQYACAQSGTATNQGVVQVLNVGASPIYQWDPTSGSPVATIVPNSPVMNEGVFVAMPQRQIIAYGSTFNSEQDPLLVRWCDVNNFSSWIGTVTNQAGSYRIPKGSKIVGAIQGPQQGLLWTDLAVWSMQYIGPPYVYSFNEVGTGCGLIAKKAATSMNGVVYWMGQSQFFRLGPNGVEPVPCPIWDVIFQQLDKNNLSKIRVAPNSRFGEIAWYYPTTNNGGEINAYVKYNVVLNQWDFGTLDRTAWINESVLGPPIGAGTNKYIYQHETSTDADGAPLVASFQTGYFALSDADVKVFVDEVWPDMKWGYYGGVQNATVNLTFYVTDFPGATPQTYGPYSLTQATSYITPRFRGRLVSIGMQSDDVGSWWRLGNMRYRIMTDGKY